MKHLLPADLPAIQARLAVDRPLHWGLARAMLAALESAWRELGRLPAAPAEVADGTPEAPLGTDAVDLSATTRSAAPTQGETPRRDASRVPTPGDETHARPVGEL